MKQDLKQCISYLESPQEGFALLIVSTDGCKCMFGWIFLVGNINDYML